MQPKEEVPFMLAAGLFLMLAALMVGIVIFFLPIFDGVRTWWFRLTVAPLALIGAGMVLFQRVRRAK
jgi:hypothetical protein